VSCGKPHETPCSEVLDRVYEYLDGELDRERMHVIKDHLEECSPCLAEFGLEDAVKAIVKRSCLDHAPADLRSKVMRRIEAVRIEIRTETFTTET
jgi:mycothiol system anti-sigma-R factor